MQDDNTLAPHTQTASSEALRKTPEARQESVDADARKLGSPIYRFLLYIGTDMAEYYPTMLSCGVTTANDLLTLAGVCDIIAAQFLCEDVGMSTFQSHVVRNALGQLLRVNEAISNFTYKTVA